MTSLGVKTVARLGQLQTLCAVEGSVVDSVRRPILNGEIRG